MNPELQKYVDAAPENIRTAVQAALCLHDVEWVVEDNYKNIKTGLATVAIEKDPAFGALVSAWENAVKSIVREGKSAGLSLEEREDLIDDVLRGLLHKVSRHELAPRDGFASYL